MLIRCVGGSVRLALGSSIAARLGPEGTETGEAETGEAEAGEAGTEAGEAGTEAAEAAAVGEGGWLARRR